MKGKLEIAKLNNVGVTAPEGFKTAGVPCGIRNGRKDLALIFSEFDSTAAAVFTKNIVQAAPVRLCREHLPNPIRAIVVNSGNANACTGDQGRQDATAMAEQTAAVLGLGREQVMVCSTGVIGELMPMDKIIAAITKTSIALGREKEHDSDAAAAILTTDTRIKRSAWKSLLPDGRTVTIGGMAKGSGMICPNMATMLAFLTTDIRIERTNLQQIFAAAVDQSFNAITVDGDTSTNDTAILLANGASGVEMKAGDPLLNHFTKMLNKVCCDLAHQIVSDGEGLTKLIKLEISGAEDEKAARIMARSVLNSPLVKTAFYGEDANWGRIIAALGYAGIDFDPERVDIFIGPYQVAENGGAVAFNEGKMKLYLGGHDLEVFIDLKQGPVTVTSWGTDLSHEYININSNYRT